MAGNILAFGVSSYVELTLNVVNPSEEQAYEQNGALNNLRPLDALHP